MNKFTFTLRLFPRSGQVCQQRRIIKKQAHGPYALTFWAHSFIHSFLSTFGSKGWQNTRTVETPFSTRPGHRLTAPLAWPWSRGFWQKWVLVLFVSWFSPIGWYSHSPHLTRAFFTLSNQLTKPLPAKRSPKDNCYCMAEGKLRSKECGACICRVDVITWSGGGQYTHLSSRPGRNRAGSIKSGRLVAANT